VNSYGAGAPNAGASLDEELSDILPNAARDPGALWEVSSFCAGNGSCVEVARLAAGDIGVRDGKLGPGSPVLTFSRHEWDAFVSGIRAGELQ
jgi:Domain of unknown function (DUF397)